MQIIVERNKMKTGSSGSIGITFWIGGVSGCGLMKLQASNSVSVSSSVPVTSWLNPSVADRHRLAAAYHNNTNDELHTR